MLSQIFLITCRPSVQIDSDPVKVCCMSTDPPMLLKHVDTIAQCHIYIMGETLGEAIQSDMLPLKTVN